MYGAYYYGQPYFAESPTYSVAPDSRDNCGGIWGTATFGQPYFGGHNQCPQPTPPPPDTRTWCGGMWGTATFGQIYFGGHIQCPEPTPPIPPIPPIPPTPGVGGIGPLRGRNFHFQRSRVNPRDIQQPNRILHDEQSRLDEEDLMLILSLWMNLK